MLRRFIQTYEINLFFYKLQGLIENFRKNPSLNRNRSGFNATGQTLIRAVLL
jgi:hypothetical protein